MLHLANGKEFLIIQPVHRVCFQMIYKFCLRFTFTTKSLKVYHNLGFVEKLFKDCKGPTDRGVSCFILEQIGSWFNIYFSRSAAYNMGFNYVQPSSKLNKRKYFLHNRETKRTYERNARISFVSSMEHQGLIKVKFVSFR